MRVRIGKRIRRRFAYHNAGFAADVAWHAHVPRHVVHAHRHAVARQETLSALDVGSPGRDRAGERKASVGMPFQIFYGEDSLLDTKGGKTGQRSFVIACRKIKARLHALDRVTIFVHIENAELDGKRVKGVGANLPRCMKGLCMWGIPHRSESLFATEVVNAIHEVISLDARDADHRIARNDLRKLVFRPPERFGRL